MKAGAHVYYTSRWARVRWIALRRDGFACVKCGARGRLEVDHIESIRRAPERAYELHNLQSLCTSCHSIKTNDEMGRAPNLAQIAWKTAVAELARPIGERTKKCLRV
ncbi:HNH endonuclease [Methylocystis sp.]|uniref:HNH endonuclease n=1 Tax=Methylocystis sp. TaxID=1911079 RepID=UPI0025F605EA|nr:HNH endonuclease [Methylocystis sp.]